MQIALEIYNLIQKMCIKSQQTCYFATTTHESLTIQAPKSIGPIHKKSVETMLIKSPSAFCNKPLLTTRKSSQKLFFDIGLLILKQGTHSLS